jgi:thioredoxin 1
MKNIFLLLLTLSLFSVVSKSFAENDEKILLVFSTNWCKYCQNAKNDMKNSSELSSLVKNYTIIDVNTDVDKEIAKGHNVTTIPAFIIYQNGKEVKRQVGYKNSQQLINFLK